jgi:hypothetical protein
MFDGFDTVRRGPERGKIPLFCRGAIGMHATRDIIRLHPRPEGAPYQLLLGLTFMFTARGKGPGDYDISDILKATEFRVKLPGSAVPYQAEMSDWEMYKVFHEGYYLLKPVSLTLSGESGDDICFAILDQYSLDPGFPFWQFGCLFEKDKLNITKQRYSLYRLGVNVPVYGPTVPGWAEEIPTELELLEMLKPGLWKGTYRVSIDLAPFKVDVNYAKYNYANTLVKLSLAIYDDGQFSYVGGKYAGDKTKPWPDSLWSGSKLTILSGQAEGKEYAIVDNIATDNNPPPGLPPNERLLRVWQPGPTPKTDGAKAGDFYRIQSHFAYDIGHPLEERIDFEPGTHGAQTLDYTFEID